MIKTLVVGGQYTDPTDWNGEIVKCEICNKQAERYDEYCEEEYVDCSSSDNESYCNYTDCTGCTDVNA